MWSIFRDYTLGNLVVITRFQNMVKYEYYVLRNSGHYYGTKHFIS